jgi:N-acetylglucosaminyldiphosphoundecaprenol N-acetyl-beta-D-mannosaminyltransferase
MVYKILGTRVDPVSYDTAVSMICSWAQQNESHYVYVANVHMVMEAYDDTCFQSMVNASDLVTPDGMPLVWTLRRMGATGQQRVYGPELTLRLLVAAAEQNIPVGFFGSTPETLELLMRNVHQRFPKLAIPYAASPPFRPLSTEENEEIIREINDSGIGILFVGLGCPKQERWMASHAGRVQAVMIGVGAAFDFIAGTKEQAPAWMRSNGFEWLFRLGHEPGRLWWRYLYHNPRFVVLAIFPLLFRRRHQAP